MKKTFWTILFSAALVLGATPAFATDPVTVFELDGNAIDNPAGYPDDWQTTNFPTYGSSIARTGVLSDPYGTTIFTQGGSKDINDVSQWRHKAGSVPPKDEITNAYAAAYISGGHLFIVAGADRYSNDGDANIGFWFFQENVAPLGDGTFGPGVHQTGDILVVVEFTGGGVVATAKVFEWNGSTIVQIAESAACSDASHGDVCAQSNAGPVQLYWAYTAKTPAGTNVAPQGSFIEMGIDLSAFFAVGQVPCFTSFLAETRSSSEPNAQLKDFVAGTFNVCGVDITKNCTAGDTNAGDTGFVWTYAGTVANIGFGPLYNVRVIDAGPDGAINTPLYGALAGDDILHTIGTLAYQTTANFGGTFETIGTTPNPAANIARVEAATVNGGNLSLSKISALANCPPVSKSKSLSINKCCNTRMVNVPGSGPSDPAKVVVAVDFTGTVCNTGQVTLTGVSVVNDNGTMATSDDTTLLSGVTLPDTPGSCASFSGSYFPSTLIVGGADPTVASFTDTVRANGNSLFGPAAEATGSWTCLLCSDNCTLAPQPQ